MYINRERPGKKGLFLYLEDRFGFCPHILRSAGVIFLELVEKFHKINGSAKM